jgi:hypothetical protein
LLLPPLLGAALSVLLLLPLSLCTVLPVLLPPLLLLGLLLLLPGLLGLGEAWSTSKNAAAPGQAPPNMRSRYQNMPTTCVLSRPTTTTASQAGSIPMYPSVPTAVATNTLSANGSR